MTYAAREPEQALDAIDSLCCEGLPDYQADLLRVRVYNQGLEGKMLDSAITIGERLARLDVAQQNLEYRQDLLEALVNACRQQHDFERADHLFHVTPETMKAHWDIFFPAYMGTTDPQVLGATIKRMMPFYATKVPYVFDMAYHTSLPEASFPMIMPMFGA